MSALQVVNHNGAARDASDVFFAPASPAIGNLVSASTSVNPMRPPPHRDWLGSLLIAGLLALIGGMAVAHLLGHDEATWSPWLLVGGAPIFAAVLALLRARPRVCTFVGDAGIAIARSRLGVGSGEVHRFAGTAAVNVGFTRGFDRGYTATAYSFDWVDEQGRIVFSIRGSFREYRIDEEALDEAAIRALPVDDRLHFARAAKRAWEAHKLNG